MRIIEKGLKPGERFIVEGLQFARPGIKVKTVTQSAAAANGQSQPAPAPTSGKIQQ